MSLGKEPGQPENRPTIELALCIRPDVLARETKALLDSCAGQVSFPLPGTSAPPQKQRPHNCFKSPKLWKPCWNWLKATFKEEFGVRIDLCKIINGATWLFIELEIKLGSRQTLLVCWVRLWQITAFVGLRITQRTENLQGPPWEHISQPQLVSHPEGSSVFPACLTFNLRPILGKGCMMKSLKWLTALKQRVLQLNWNYFSPISSWF